MLLKMRDKQLKQATSSQAQQAARDSENDSTETWKEQRQQLQPLQTSYTPLHTCYSETYTPLTPPKDRDGYDDDYDCLPPEAATRSVAVYV